MNDNDYLPEKYAVSAEVTYEDGSKETITYPSRAEQEEDLRKFNEALNGLEGSCRDFRDVLQEVVEYKRRRLHRRSVLAMLAIAVLTVLPAIWGVQHALQHSWAFLVDLAVVGFNLNIWFKVWNSHIDVCGTRGGE